MASYNNLSTLAGLAVGDVVTYNTATTIDFKKYKVKVELYGVKSTQNGGLTQFDLDTKDLPSQTLTYSPLGGTSLCYGSSYDKYYRIGVAGNAGEGYYGGTGGGTTGGNGSTNTDYGSAYGGKGGTQTSGGAGGSWSANGCGPAVVSSGGSGKTGSFGTNSSTGDYECAGWYAGGTGGYFKKGSMYNYATKYGGNGGGSGFVIGQSTTTYPSGYMGNNNTNITSLASSISNVTLTQGGSTETTGKMVLTILEVPKSFPKYYNGSAWVDTIWKRYNGSSWEDIEIKYYDGSTWV